MIERRLLGRKGIPVSVLGFGGAPLGDLYARLEEGGAVSTVAAARAAGMTLFDTSPLYGNGLGELRLGAGLRQGGREGVVLSTKVGRVMDPRQSPPPTPTGVDTRGFVGGVPHRALFDYSYDGTLRSFEQSLLRLGVDQIDILLIHDVDVWTHGEGYEARFREAMDGAYPALDRLRQEGEPAASQLRDTLDRLQPGLGNPVMKVEVREEPATAEADPLVVSSSTTSSSTAADDPTDLDELHRMLTRISERLAELERRLG